MQTEQAVGAQQTYRMDKEVHERFVKFHENHPYISVNRIINCALSYYLDAAEKGVDSRLNPIKPKKL